MPEIFTKNNSKRYGQSSNSYFQVDSASATAVKVSKTIQSEAKVVLEVIARVITIVLVWYLTRTFSAHTNVRKNEEERGRKKGENTQTK
jgi:hypothetical protein